MDFNGHELAHLNSDLNFRSLGNRRRVAKTQPCQRFKETPQCKSSFIINHQEFSWKRTTNNFWFQEHPFYTDMKPLWAFAPLVIFWILMKLRVALWLLDCRVIMIPGKTEDNKDEIFLKTFETSRLINSVRSWIVKRHCQPFLPQPLVVWHCHVNNNRCNNPAMNSSSKFWSISRLNFRPTLMLSSCNPIFPILSLSLCG